MVNYDHSRIIHGPFPMDLSIVIIARNEESTIGRNLEVIASEIAGKKAEIILVDSASSDQTVEIARTYPVRIVHLEPGPLLSPSAGRYIGTILSRGRFVFFLDGDMILIPGWLEKGLKELEQDSLAGVAGRIYWVLPGEDLSHEHPDDFPLGDIKAIGLSAIYRRDALIARGTFNPYIKGEEEIELGFRLIQGGYSLKRVEIPMAYHIDKPRTVGALNQKAKYFAGTGQILRRYPGTELAGRLISSTAHVFTQQLVLVFVLLFLLGAFALGRNDIGGLMLAALAVILGGLALWKGPSKILLYLRSLVMISYYMTKGFIAGLPDGAGFEKRIRYTISGQPE